MVQRRYQLVRVPEESNTYHNVEGHEHDEIDYEEDLADCLKAGESVWCLRDHTCEASGGHCRGEPWP